eukprot:4597175-Amphidinium_carterae.1
MLVTATVVMLKGAVFPIFGSNSVALHPQTCVLSASGANEFKHQGGVCPCSQCQRSGDHVWDIIVHETHQTQHHPVWLSFKGLPTMFINK